MSSAEDIQAWREYARDRCKERKIPFRKMYDPQIGLESNWDHYDSRGNVKSSPTGSMGLGQINKRYYLPHQWTDPYDNLDTSTIIMEENHKRFGSWKKALAAYNWGPGHVGGGIFDDGRGFGIQTHSPWDGTRDWVCSAGHGVSAQCKHYLDVILGPEWSEPENEWEDVIVPPPGDTFSVGPGALELMRERGDRPATDEIYIVPDWSVCFGESGRQYVYLKSTNRTHVYEPKNLAVVGGNNHPPGNLEVPWSREHLITNGFSTAAEWRQEFGVDRKIQSLVWHDMEGYLAGAIARWNTGAAGAHICILRNGEVVLTCPLEHVAWHAGTNNIVGSTTYGRTPYWRTHNINPYSVGIELEGFVVSGYTPQQVEACVKVGVYLTRKYGIEPIAAKEVLTGHHLHGELSAMRTDPGPLFPYTEILGRIQEQTR